MGYGSFVKPNAASEEVPVPYAVMKTALELATEAKVVMKEREAHLKTKSLSLVLSSLKEKANEKYDYFQKLKHIHDHHNCDPTTPTVRNWLATVQAEWIHCSIEIIHTLDTIIHGDPTFVDVEVVNFRNRYYMERISGTIQPQPFRYRENIIT